MAVKTLNMVEYAEGFATAAGLSAGKGRNISTTSYDVMGGEVKGSVTNAKRGRHAERAGQFS